MNETTKERMNNVFQRMNLLEAKAFVELGGLNKLVGSMRLFSANPIVLEPIIKFLTSLSFLLGQHLPFPLLIVLHGLVLMILFITEPSLVSSNSSA